MDTGVRLTWWDSGALLSPLLTLHLHDHGLYLLSTRPAVLTSLQLNHMWIIYQSSPILMNRCNPLPRMHQLCFQNHTTDIAAFVLPFLYIPLRITPADWHLISVLHFLCFPSQLLSLGGIKSSSLLSPPPLHASYIFLPALLTQHMATCVLLVLIE